MDYNSKYKSSEIEEILDSVGGKQDKENGKGLSTEDFTTALKTKLESLSNYDDTQIENAVSSLQTQLNTLVGGNVSDAIESFNEIIAFLDGIADSEDLNSIIASIEQQIANKANADSLAKVATSGSYTDLKNQPTIPSAVTESTVSGWGFTKNTGTYSKPSTGIPFSDFEEQVQGSIIKAEESVQSVSASVTTGNATAGNFFNVNKDANGNVSIQMIQNTLASGKIAIPYTTDVKQYIDNAVANAGGGGKEVVRVAGDIDLLEPNKVYIRPNDLYVLQITQIAQPSERYGEYYIMGLPPETGSYTHDISIVFPANIQIVWANGQIPSINSNDCWELSIVYTKSIAPIYKCVLTKFALA